MDQSSEQNSALWGFLNCPFPVSHYWMRTPGDRLYTIIISCSHKWPCSGRGLFSSKVLWHVTKMVSNKVTKQSGSTALDNVRWLSQFRGTWVICLVTKQIDFILRRCISCSHLFFMEKYIFIVSWVMYVYNLQMQETKN